MRNKIMADLKEIDGDYGIVVSDMTFHVVDYDKDDFIRDKDGKAKVYRARYYDYSYLADGLDVDDLVEV